MNKDELKKSNNDIHLWLRITDPKKQRHTHRENEAIQFEYHIGADVPEHVAQEMVSTALGGTFFCGTLHPVNGEANTIPTLD